MTTQTLLPSWIFHHFPSTPRCTRCLRLAKPPRKSPQGRPLSRTGSWTSCWALLWVKWKGIVVCSALLSWTLLHKSLFFPCWLFCICWDGLGLCCLVVVSYVSKLSGAIVHAARALSQWDLACILVPVLHNPEMTQCGCWLQVQEPTKCCVMKGITLLSYLSPFFSQLW